MDVAIAEKKQGKPVKRTLSSVFVPAFLVLIGICILLYPVVSSQWNNLRQIEIAQSYTEVLSKVSPEKRNAILEEAEEYNRHAQTGPVFDPWLTRIAPDNTEYNAYLETLDGSNGAPMSRLLFPKTKIDLPIYHGSSDYTLQHGVGHLFGSALPVGGVGTHAVLTGHTGLTNATLFDNLAKAKIGDPFYVDTFGRKMKYVVDQIDVVLPEDTDALKIDPDRDLVTLVTCTPYGINSHRLLVTGHRVPIDEAKETQAFTSALGQSLTWQWWMLLSIVFAAIVALALLWWVTASLIKIRRDNKSVVTASALKEGPAAE